MTKSERFLINWSEGDGEQGTGHRTKKEEQCTSKWLTFVCCVLFGESSSSGEWSKWLMTEIQRQILEVRVVGGEEVRVRFAACVNETDSVSLFCSHPLAFSFLSFILFLHFFLGFMVSVFFLNFHINHVDYTLFKISPLSVHVFITTRFYYFFKIVPFVL